MTKSQEILGIIPARSGSKGIPGKNKRKLAGQYLIDYTVEAARKAEILDRLILSTDSDKIAEIGRQCGVEVPFRRPEEFATDETPMIEVLIHSLKELQKIDNYQPDWVMLLQPTSPLRKPEHLQKAVELSREPEVDAVASVVEIPAHYSPQYVMKIVEGKLEYYLPEGENIKRRQDVKTAYSRDGTVYLTKRAIILQDKTLYGDFCKPMIIPQEESLSLDTMDDWEKAEYIFSSSLGVNNK